MVRDPIEVLEIAWFMRAGRPSKPIDDYDPLTVHALMLYSEDALKADSLGVPLVRWPKGASGPAITGDPLIDEWERKLASGEPLDLNRR